MAGFFKKHAQTIMWLVALIVVGYLFQAQRSLSNETRTSLCVLRLDLERQVKGSVDFLAKHPDGAFGFTKAEILAGIDRQSRTILALSTLDCTHVEIPRLPKPTVTPAP